MTIKLHGWGSAAETGALNMSQLKGLKKKWRKGNITLRNSEILIVTDWFSGVPVNFYRSHSFLS